ncbi:hypothetical protein [Arthrobacter polaris]|uniref:hypothetical protein n=1 Tax=Arthrobacter polaris TaxID=2813727 RepID=UPI001F339466|nr:hypothetical protein [Arthrobacter polaris]UIK88943.1 hypothetical protein J0916_00005 [Arthrobacter polaris]
MLITRLGLRGIDVKRLEFKDLDWPGNSISVVQAKTGRRCDAASAQGRRLGIDRVHSLRPAHHGLPAGVLSNLLIMHKVADLNEIWRQYVACAKSLGTADGGGHQGHLSAKARLHAADQGSAGVDRGRVRARGEPTWCGLWKVGNRSFIVANQVTTDELAVFGTDERMPATAIG